MKTQKSSLEFSHFPVMLSEVIKISAPSNGGFFVDCTFGGGGYSRAILKNFNVSELLAIDRDPISKILSKIGAKSIINALDKIENGTAKFKEQDHDQATYAKKIRKEESQIDWDEDASKIIGKINGLFPSPGASFTFNNERSFESK